jgi:hypothetical protein
MAGNQRDALVVPGEEFAAVLQELIDYHDSLREGVQWTKLGPNGGVRWVADQVGADSGRVRAVLHQKWVTLRVVDEWLTALGLTHVLPILTVLPNPNWSVLHWVEYMAERGCDAE